ncbi:MAG: GIY-YIG nuclease family protein [Candidatus Promineifilaceae bacterium]
MGDERLILLGNEQVAAGTYLLRLHVPVDVWVRYGRVARQPIHTPPGEVVYIGSALGKRGMPLARRLLRHACRAGGHPSQPITDALVAYWGLPLPPKKSLKWHVDYLLQHKDVSLTHVVAVRDHVRLEPALAAWIVDQPGFVPAAAGLGASDAPTAAHLLYNSSSLDVWWRALPRAIEAQFGDYLEIGD